MTSTTRMCIFLLALAVPNCAVGARHKFPAEVSVTFTDEDLGLQFLYALWAFESVVGMSATPNQTEELFNSLWSTTWVVTPWECTNTYTQPHGLCYAETGAFIDGTGYWMVLAAADCAPLTSWSHEWLHIFSREFLGTWDSAHENTKLFLGNRPLDKFPNVAEVQANAAGVQLGLCNTEESL